MRQDFPESTLFSLSGNSDFSWIPSPPRWRSGGIHVGINKKYFDILEKAIDYYFITTLLRNNSNGFTWNIEIYYSDGQANSKSKFIVELFHITNKFKTLSTLTGDYQMTRIILFDSIISQEDLMELTMCVEHNKICINYNHDNQTYELIDRVVISPTYFFEKVIYPPWEEWFPQVNALSGDLRCHAPL